ncbi:RNA polymerase sigma factor [Nonomuraea sp. NPDC051941]|uniref:RNA polymerase sigma factor n=1 Tax=Nonomuraea sp. NPDC051941 TaxID=3364373 RepID=UPI0037CB87B6
MTPNAMARETDTALIECSLQQPECFAALFHRHNSPIHGYAERRLSRPLVDDIAAETYLIAFDRRDTCDLSRSDVRPWLYGIASNLTSHHHRTEIRPRTLARMRGKPVRTAPSGLRTRLTPSPLEVGRLSRRSGTGTCCC